MAVVYEPCLWKKSERVVGEFGSMNVSAGVTVEESLCWGHGRKKTSIWFAVFMVPKLWAVILSSRNLSIQDKIIWPNLAKSVHVTEISLSNVLMLPIPPPALILFERMTIYIATQWGLGVTMHQPLQGKTASCPSHFFLQVLAAQMAFQAALYITWQLVLYLSLFTVVPQLSCDRSHVIMVPFKWSSSPVLCMQ